MNEILKDNDLKDELQGREALKGSLLLKDSNHSICEFYIEDVIHAGGSCICYRATQFFENDDISTIGTLKEFYPIRFGYPGPSYNLSRRDIDDGDYANQLYLKPSMHSDFEKARNEFYAAYKKISDLKKTDSKKQYDNFFAPVNIYFGMPKEDDKNNYTVYIWTPGDNALVSFDEHLKDMQKEIFEKIDAATGDTDVFLAERLRTVLQAIKAAAIGIEKLHFDDLLHLDIKPANFGIRTLGQNNGDHVTVSLFDINTIYFRSDPLVRTGGTLHFRAPEMIDDTKNNDHLIEIGTQSDIFSLGATLYNSIIIKSADSRGEYDYEDFGSIDIALKHSYLIEYSEINSKADLHDILSGILKRSLARRHADYYEAENYDGVGELIADLEAADCILSAQIASAKKNGAGKKVLVKAMDKEDYFDESIDTGAIGAIQCLLYDKPLYHYINDHGELSILVLGCGTYSQKFIDIAFEMSQVKGCYLNVTVLTDNKEKDELRYLHIRPEFHHFFRVNGKMPDRGDYGSIKFLNIKTSDNDKAEFDENVDNAQIIKDTIGKEKFSYVFISVVEEALNRKIAEDLAVSDLIDTSNKTQQASVNFVWYGDMKNTNQGLGASFVEKKCSAEERGIHLHPVEVQQTLSKHKDYRFLCQMAFNCHLLWGDGLNVDIKKTYSQFRSAYNFHSSLSNVLSIKYKLNSIGICFDDLCSSKTGRAKILSEITTQYKHIIGIDIDKNTDKDGYAAAIETLNELTAYEHRRWVTNCITSLSMQTMDRQEYRFLKTDNKDKKRGKHPCIVPSTPEWALNSGKWKTDLSTWDVPEIEKDADFEKLDDLDKMSVRLHRHFMGLSKNYKIENIATDAGMIRRYLYGNRNARIAFDAFIASIMAIISINRAAKDADKKILRSRVVTVYEQYARNLDGFRKCLHDGLPNVEEIRKRLKAIIDGFMPVKLANEYTDYKSKDQMLVRNIPFILNYTTSIRIGVPFEKDINHNVWFSNVASSIILNPSVVTFFINAGHADAITEEIRQALINSIGVMNAHHLQSRINLIIFANANGSDFTDEAKASVKEELYALSDRIYTIDIIACHDKKDLSARIENVLLSNMKSTARFSAIEENDTVISREISKICSLIAAPGFPVYTFRSEKGRFQKASELCKWFNDIPFHSHLIMEDIFRSQDKVNISNEPELQSDYKDIWENCYSDRDPVIRTKKSTAWKILCGAIKKHTAASDVLLDMDISTYQNPQDTEPTVIYAPAVCKDGLAKILKAFASGKLGLVCNAEIENHNSSTLTVSFRSSRKTKDMISDILQNPYMIADAGKINICMKENRLQIIFDSLIVKNFSWSKIREEFHLQGKDSIYDFAENALGFLLKHSYLIKKENAQNPDALSFCFSSNQIKMLLTDEGKLPEVYTYYKLLEDGYFDEVKSSVEFQQDKNGTDAEDSSVQKLNIVTIKGFRTQIVEIRGSEKLQDGFYDNLKAADDNYGINKQLIVVLDSDELVSEEKQALIEQGKASYMIDTIYEGMDSVEKQLAELMKQADF